MSIAQFSWINKAWKAVSSIVSGLFKVISQPSAQLSAKQLPQLTEQKQSKVEKMIPQNQFPHPKNNPFFIKKAKKSQIVDLLQISSDKGNYLKGWFQQNQKLKQKAQQAKRANRFWDKIQSKNKNAQTRTSSSNKMKDQNHLRQLQFLRKYQQSLQRSNIQFLNKSKSEFDRFQLESFCFQSSIQDNIFSQHKSPLTFKKNQKSKKISFKNYLKSGKIDISPNGLFRDLKGDDISSIQRHSQMIEQSQPQIVKFARIPIPIVLHQLNQPSLYKKYSFSSKQKKNSLQNRRLFIPQVKQKHNMDPDLKFMINFKLQEAGLNPQMAYGNNNQIRIKILKIIENTVDKFNKYQRYCRDNEFIGVVNSSDSINFDVNISSDIYEPKKKYQYQNQDQNQNVSIHILDQLLKQKQLQKNLQQKQNSQHNSSQFKKKKQQPFKSTVKWQKVISSNQNYEIQNAKSALNSFKKNNSENQVKNKNQKCKYQFKFNENQSDQSLSHLGRKRRHF